MSIDFCEIIDTDRIVYRTEPMCLFEGGLQAYDVISVGVYEICDVTSFMDVPLSVCLV